MIKIYTDLTHYSVHYRTYLCDVLRPFIKEMELSDEELVNIYGAFAKEYKIVDNIKDCDFAILAMEWEYYYLTNQTALALEFITKVGSAMKQTVTFTGGDFGVTPPRINNIIILRRNGYGKKRLSYQYGMPAFITCPMRSIFGKSDIEIRAKSAKPIIGFCGQAKTSYKKNIVDICRTLIRNTKYYTGLSIWEPHTLYPSTLLRQKVLEIVEKDPRLTTNFIKRTHYRAGSKSSDDRQKTTIEFFQNMSDSDYIVCIRGGGNFSVRLYETLAMGRIPIFINTDCILPYDNIIDWKKYCVWVEMSEIDKLPDLVLEFHASMTDEQFKQRQISCRKLWEKYLTISGFFMNLPQLISK